MLSRYFVFAIGAVLSGSESAALAGATVYALLVNTNLYVRHLVPYGWALAVGLSALWLAVTRPRTRGLAIGTRALTGAVLNDLYGLLPAVRGAGRRDPVGGVGDTRSAGAVAIRAWVRLGDGWTFLPEYLPDVERASGLVLILGAVVYTWNAALRIARAASADLPPMLVAAIRRPL